MVKSALHYLAGTSDHGLFLQNESPLPLHAFFDSGWAGDPNDHSSTTAYVMFLGYHTVSRSSKKQRAMTHSSKEAEYRASASTTTELCRVRNLLKQLSVMPDTTPVAYYDNLGAIYVCANLVFYSHIKHIELDYILSVN